MWLALTLLAHAGYGDPVDGHPTWDERAVHLWTNAARVAPDAWQREYADGDCAFSEFQPSEQTPKAPLRWNVDLADAAVAHNDDMVDNDFFDHVSSDGTPFDERVWSYYDGRAIGENIAWGYGSSREAVLSGWMCSPPHRSNLMAASFEEIGTGARARTYTQDFGARGIAPRAVSSSLHQPARPSSRVDLLADAHGDVDSVVAVLDGEEIPLDLIAGRQTSGLFGATVPVGGGCHTWYAEVRLSDGTAVRHPETGSWAWGACAFDDAAAGWVGHQVEPSEEPEDTGEPGDTDEPGDTGEPDGTDDPDDPADPTETPETQGRAFSGCDTVTAGGSAALLGILLVLVGRRRRS